MKIISGHKRKGLTCHNCKTNLSVKYTFEGKTYCNKCIVPIAYKKEEE